MGILTNTPYAPNFIAFWFLLPYVCECELYFDSLDRFFMFEFEFFFSLIVINSSFIHSFTQKKSLFLIFFSNLKLFFYYYIYIYPAMVFMCVDKLPNTTLALLASASKS